MSTNVSKAPRQLGSKAETFAALCRDFEIDKKVEVLLNESGMNNLEDFRYFFDDMENVRTFVAADKTLKDNVLRIQVARLRNAWDSYCVLAKKRDQGQATHQTNDLDDPLEEETLRGVVENWWTRHKVKFPPNFTPGDQAIARCYRELMTRLLTVADVWKIKDRLHQVTSTSKKVRIANMDLWKGEAEKDPQHPRTASQYLRCLHTYFLAQNDTQILPAMLAGDLVYTKKALEKGKPHPLGPKRLQLGASLLNYVASWELDLVGGGRQKTRSSNTTTSPK